MAMGSGNKEKRKKGLKSDGPKAPPGKEPTAKVSFDMEPDADAIFLESLDSMDVRKAQRDDDDFPPQATAKRSSGGSSHELDLHRMTVSEATRAVDHKVAEILAGLAKGAEVTLKIITGKGLHSGPGGGVLARDVHDYVKNRYALQIVHIEESPAKATLGGVPLRGHFNVKLRAR